MTRLEYIVRRFLLMIPTFLGITLICFTLCQFVPGGPVEQAILKMRGLGTGNAPATGQAASIPPEQRKAIEKYFGFDQPILARYWKWLVVDRIGMRIESYAYPNKTVWQLIKQRFPISLTFGLTGFLLSYLICIPLGIAKALRNGKPFDFASSVIVFIGYAIPPFAFGMLLKMLFCGTNDIFYDWFPLGGFRSADGESLSAWGQFADIVYHMFLPVLCYVIGNFSLLTILMKNSLLEQIGQDYVRTVLARGASVRYAIWRHTLRNALIPIATGFGGVMMLILAGSVLIERVFDIPGMGLLSFDAIVGRDYMVFMGVLALSAMLGMLGRLLSDISYMLIDPRITFDS